MSQCVIYQPGGFTNCGIGYRKFGLEELEERKLMPRKIIEKKILPKYFDEVIRDKKKFEIRKDEDDLQIGDAVILKEWDGEKYTGRETGRNIVYILRDVPEYGLMPGYVIFGW